MVADGEAQHSCATRRHSPHQGRFETQQYSQNEANRHDRTSDTMRPLVSQTYFTVWEVPTLGLDRQSTDRSSMADKLRPGWQ